MRLEGLQKELIQSPGYLALRQGMKEKKYPVGIYGISESARAFLISSVYAKEKESLFVFAANDLDAKNLYEDLLLYESEVYFFPGKDLVFYNIDAISGDLRWERLKVLKELMDPRKKIIVTTIDTLTAAYAPLEHYKAYQITIDKTMEIDLKDLSEKLVSSGYHRTELVEGKGEFALRGGILDVFPPQESLPYRIELFGDEVDSLRTFHPGTQRSIEQVDGFEIFPAKEMILPKDIMEAGAERIQKEMDQILAKTKKKQGDQRDAAEKLKSHVDKNLEYLREGLFFEAVDSYLPFFFERPSTFFDFMGNSKMVVTDTGNALGKIQSTYLQFGEDYRSYLGRGEILPSQGNLVIDEDYLMEMIKERKIITLNAFQKTERFLPPRSLATFNQMTIYNYQGKLSMLLDDIKEKKKRGYSTVILAGTRSRGERLVTMLREEDLDAVYKDTLSTLDYPNVVVTFGSQGKGFEFPDLKLAVISDKEVFGEAKRKKKKGNKGEGLSKIKSFTELKKGDYVVHINHGIGVYLGIKQMETSGIIRDYLEISYDKNDKLFIPVDQLDMIQRYIGSEGKRPKVNKLGGQEWSKAKAKVKRSVDEIAEDLVKLYAEREKVKGFPFEEDTPWQKQFEDEFPFEETEDQLKSVVDIKKDMESEKVMDRLLCGDVGYGKTEVAMRAAFKAVMDSKQVAVLVPTTILAEQHYHSFRKRFQAFPIKIDMLSRFRSAKEQKETMKRAQEGNVDILIGTHRILSKQLTFKDLGLLVVDEEQRFGVAHKEKLKAIKKNVDVLTLSATPIPRTLHMSLSGIRDISIIETPPEERYPIQTYVVEFNEQLVRDAILKEKARNGQVYVVHNRVEDIDVMASYLQKLIPEVIIDVAHGQMNERELESSMKNFMDQMTDVLVCTTIIETGMDIQNVNTIIVNNADKLGLSQLYQLRGRVGRTNRMAYAYLTYQKDKVLTEVAEKRLRALKDFTALGSGFKIAMRDLEIRGAGNLMGKAQHGEMSVVGYDLYVKMLNIAIKAVTGEVMEEEMNTTIEIKVSAYIPSSYIEDEMHKIEIYKKIASMLSEEDYEEIKEELLDRYSDIPDALYNLMDIARLKFYASQAGVLEIKDRGPDILITFQTPERLSLDKVEVLMSNYHKQIAFQKKTPSVSFITKEKNPDVLIAKLTTMMKELKAVEEVAK